VIDTDMPEMWPAARLCQAWLLAFDFGSGVTESHVSHTSKPQVRKNEEGGAPAGRRSRWSCWSWSWSCELEHGAWSMELELKGWWLVAGGGAPRAARRGLHAACRRPKPTGFFVAVFCLCVCVCVGACVVGVGVGCAPPPPLPCRALAL
jgi:hypothetical protein